MTFHKASRDYTSLKYVHSIIVAVVKIYWLSASCCYNGGAIICHSLPLSTEEKGINERSYIYLSQKILRRTFRVVPFQEESVAHGQRCGGISCNSTGETQLLHDPKRPTWALMQAGDLITGASVCDVIFGFPSYGLQLSAIQFSHWDPRPTSCSPVHLSF